MNLDESKAIREGSILMEYLPKLVRLAEANMSSRLKRKIGPDDMAGSILGSVIRLKRLGKLPVSMDESDDFWRLIVTIALCKIRKKARFYRAAKRNFERELNVTDDMPLLEEIVVAEGEPTDSDGAWLATVLETLQSELNDDEQVVLSGKLEGKGGMEIAMALNGGQGRSTKTVTRIWQRIQERTKEIADTIED